MEQLNQEIVETVGKLKELKGDAFGASGQEIRRLVVGLFDKIRARAKELGQCLELVPGKRHFIEKVLFWENGGVTDKLHSTTEESLIFRHQQETNELTDGLIDVFHIFLLHEPRLAISSQSP